MKEVGMEERAEGRKVFVWRKDRRKEGDMEERKIEVRKGGQKEEGRSLDK